MIRSVLAFSVANRYAVILVTLIAAAFGAWSLTRLPIDAVPDVTNNQVQINVIAPALTPVEVEKQVTVLVERALAGTPGLESMRSFSRNGFAQLTAVFSDRVDVYFARSQVNERLVEVRGTLPPGSKCGSDRSRPASARSTGGPSNTGRPATDRPSGKASPAGSRTAAI
jgi:cobalt-zinc-cadmium resistance protein CzcA